jgi:hypothetical protein
MVLAGVGLALCFASFLGTFLGRAPSKRAIMAAFIGVFILQLPTILIMNVLTRDFKQKDLWKSGLRGCPRWMRISLWTLVGCVMALTFGLPVILGKNPADSSGFSLFPAVFYAVQFCVMYSALHVDKLDADRKCLNGHRMSASAKFCEECGSPLRMDTA